MLFLPGWQGGFVAHHSAATCTCDLDADQRRLWCAARWTGKSLFRNPEATVRMAIPQAAGRRRLSRVSARGPKKRRVREAGLALGCDRGMSSGYNAYLDPDFGRRRS